jgi:hypothetical protein
MKTKVHIIIEATVITLADLFNLLTYLLLALFVANILFEVKLNPQFPLQDERLVCGAIGTAFISILLKLWLLRHD